MVNIELENKYKNACLIGDTDMVLGMLKNEDKKLKNIRFLQNV